MINMAEGNNMGSNMVANSSMVAEEDMDNNNSNNKAGNKTILPSGLLITQHKLLKVVALLRATRRVPQLQRLLPRVVRLLRQVVMASKLPTLTTNNSIVTLTTTEKMQLESIMEPGRLPQEHRIHMARILRALRQLQRVMQPRRLLPLHPPLHRRRLPLHRRYRMRSQEQGKLLNDVVYRIFLRG